MAYLHEKTLTKINRDNQGWPRGKSSEGIRQENADQVCKNCSIQVKLCDRIQCCSNLLLQFLFLATTWNNTSLQIKKQCLPKAQLLWGHMKIFGNQVVCIASNGHCGTFCSSF